MPWKNDNWSGKNDNCPGKMTIGLVNMTNAETLTEAKEVKGSEKRKRLADLLKNQKKDLFFTRCAQIKKPEKKCLQRPFSCGSIYFAAEKEQYNNR